MLKQILNLLNIGQPLVLTITLIVLIKYTYETYKLRLETQKQTEIMARPFIIIVRAGAGSGFLLKNIGNSPALNIKIEPINLTPGTNKKVPLIFDQKEIIEAGKEIIIKAKVIDSDSNTMLLDSDIANCNYLFSYSDNRPIELNIKYTNIIGQEYLTKESIFRRNIEFKSFQKL